MTTYVIQNHIHLALALGSAPENAPDTIWKVADQAEIPVMFGSVRRGLHGHLRFSRVMSGGNPLQLTNWEFKVKIEDTDTATAFERKAALKALHGQKVYFVPNYHCNDGVDHTPYVVQVYVAHVGKFAADDTKLRFYYVDIELEDASLL